METGNRRTKIERRKFTYTHHMPEGRSGERRKKIIERRSGTERRSGFDRRKSIAKRTTFSSQNKSPAGDLKEMKSS